MPMNKEELKMMKKSLDEADELLRTAMLDISQAKRAGIDVADNEKRAIEMKEQIRKMRAAYLF